MIDGRGWGDLDALTNLADTLAGAWAGRAAASTTLGQERALLRLFGVAGLDRDGRPLASQVVERYIGTSAARLASGILLPFAMALLEYDISPQDLALDVASGAVDLALEADLLHDPERRSLAEREATRLALSAADRIDANRTARRELVAAAGGVAAAVVRCDARGGRSGTGAGRGAAVDRRGRGPHSNRRSRGPGIECARAISIGVGRHPHPGPEPYSATDTAAARARRGAVPYGRPDVAGVPAGSQRGLAELRHAIDQAAAERRRYVRLATLSPALAAPELAVVAEFRARRRRRSRPDRRDRRRRRRPGSRPRGSRLQT